MRSKAWACGNKLNTGPVIIQILQCKKKVQTVLVHRRDCQVLLTNRDKRICSLYYKVKVKTSFKPSTPSLTRKSC